MQLVSGSETISTVIQALGVKDNFQLDLGIVGIPQ